MNRRDFLKSMIATTTGISSGLLSLDVISADYSVVIEQEKNTQNLYKNLLNERNQNRLFFNEFDEKYFSKNGERKIWLYRESTKEQGFIVYANKDGYLKDNYAKLCYLLRDVTGEKNRINVPTTVLMNPRLFDLLFSIQSFFFDYGHFKPLIVKSGYRTRLTNNNIEGAAKNSMHTYGMACDFVLEGISSTYISKLAYMYKSGGVGFYPNKNFTHVDVGKIRVWKS